MFLCKFFTENVYIAYLKNNKELIIKIFKEIIEF
jgi:hypothetical protein